MNIQKYLRQYRGTPPLVDVNDLIDDGGNDNVVDVNDLIETPKKKDGGSVSSSGVKPFSKPASPKGINDLKGSDAPAYFKQQQQAYNKAQVPEVDDDPVGNVVRKSAVRKQEIKQQHANSDATYVAGNYQNISKEVDQLNKEERAANNYRFETTADAKGVLQKFAPNIDELPDDAIANLDVKDNLTAQRAKEQVLDSRNIGKILSSNLTFESAAVQFGALKNPLIAKQIEAQGGNLFASKSQKGALVADLLTQPAVKEWASASQENMNAYRAAQNNFMTNYPDLAASQLATILSKEREKRELNNGLLNSVSNEEMDAIVSDMVAKGDLTQQQRVVYEKLLRPQTKGLRNPYQTPGLFENLPKATKESLKGMARSVEEGIDYVTPGDLVDEAVATQQDLEEDYTRVDFKPKGLWHEFSSATATLTPQVLLMGTGIKGLQAINAIKNPAISGALMEGMQSYGYNVSEARKQFPNEPVKQMAHATLTTAFEMAMSRVFPDEKVVEGIGKAFRGKTAGVIADFAEGKITSAAAKDLIQSDVQRILTETLPQFVGKTLKNTQKEALEEVVPQVLSDVLTDVFEGKPVE
jgi:predicted transcriptional regulator